MQTEKLMELGARLKGRRLELGLEREEVAIKLKVSAKTLYALEEALDDSLPQPIFARGFVRSYAKIMNMDLAELDTLINEAFPAAAMDNINPELSAAAREQSITINQTSNAKVLLVAVPLLLLVIVGIGMVVYHFWGDNIKDAVNRPAVTSQSGTTASNAPPARGAQPYTPAPAANQADSTAHTQAAPMQTASATPEVPASSRAAEPAPSAPTAAAPEAAAPQPATAARPADYPPNLVTQSNARADSPIPAGSMRVVLFAKYECWIGAEFDDYGRRSFTLEPGQTFVLDFKSKLKLTLGNAGGIDMSYNGAAYDTGGRFRESKVLNFPPQ